MIEIPNYNRDRRVVLLAIGLQGSGKSTALKQLVSSDPNRWKRINRDDVRAMIHCGAHDYTSKSHEDAVTRVCDSALRGFLEAGYDVTIDNTHLAARDRKSAHEIAEEFGALVIEKVFEVPLEECLRRNALREGVARVPEAVIRDKAKKFGVSKYGKFAALQDKVFDYSAKTAETYVQDESLPPAIVVDLDGTLCIVRGRNPYDASRCEEDSVNEPVLQTLCKFADEGTKVIFMSGRSDKYRPETERWLRKNVPYSHLFPLYMRSEGDVRKDSIVKRELFDQNVCGRHRILFVLDDRSQVVNMWRSIGLMCFQVAPGNF